MKAKICVMGEFSVGKTSITRRFVKNAFDAAYRATLGVSILQKSLEVKGEAFDLILWDLEGGHDRLAALQSYFIGASGAVLVADASRPSTIEKLPIYLEFLREHVPDISAVIALNKADLIDVDDFDLGQICVDLGLSRESNPIALTSAATGSRVEELFTSLCESMQTQKSLGSF